MTVKYHINKYGVPAVCKAKPGNCPRGGEGGHFDDLDDAQAEANRRGEAEFDILTEIKDIEGQSSNTKNKSWNGVRRERRREEEQERKERFNRYLDARRERVVEEDNIVSIHGMDLDLREVVHPKGNNSGRKPGGRGRVKGLLYIDHEKAKFEQEKEKAENETDPIPYYFRMDESRRISNEMEKGKNTFHYNVDRKGRRVEMERLFGKGKVIGNYLIHHDVSEMGEPESYEWQIAEVKNTGQITIYSERTKKAITTFMPSEAKMKAIIVKAGEVPNKEFLETVGTNRQIWVKENNAEQIQKDYRLERKKRRKQETKEKNCAIEENPENQSIDELVENDVRDYAKSDSG